jgi:hypothetical protein
VDERPRGIALLGSTGSIGRQAIEVIAGDARFRVVALAAGAQADVLAEQIERLRPSVAALADRSAASAVAERAGSEGTTLLIGDDGRGIGTRLGLGALGLAVSCGLFVLGFLLATARVVPTRWLLPGALVAALVWQLLLTVGRLLVEHSLRGANEVYGTFATVIGLLAWFAVQAQVTMYAVELDVVRAHRLAPRLLAPPLTDADERALTSYVAAQARVPDQHVTVTYGDAQPVPEPAPEPAPRPHPSALPPAVLGMVAGVALGLALRAGRRASERVTERGASSGP